MSKLIITGLIVIAAAILFGCQQTININPPANSNANAAGGGNAKWDAYVEQFLKEYFDANPQFGAYQGKHEYDGMLADWSEAGLKKDIDRLKA